MEQTSLLERLLPCNSKVTFKVRDDLKQYFEVVDDAERKLKCKLEGKDKCPVGKIIKYSGTSWFNFERHLETCHSIQVKKKTPLANQPVISTAFLPRVKQQFSTGNNYKRNHPKQLQYENNVLDFISIDGNSLDSTGKAGYIKMIKDLDSSINIPSRRTIGRRFKTKLSKIRTEHQTVIEKLPNGTLHLSLDLWSTRAHFSVLGVKMHFITGKYELKTLTVTLKHFDHTKTGHNLRLFFKQLLQTELRIKAAQVGAIMADNASENVKAFNMQEFLNDAKETYDDEEFELGTTASSDEEDQSDDEVTEYISEASDQDSQLELDAQQFMLPDDSITEELDESVTSWQDDTKFNFIRLGCVAHALQLVLKDAFKDNKTASHMIKIIDKLVTFFHKSNHWNTKLVKKTGLTIVRPAPTRWNSVLFALDRILKDNFLQKLNEVLVSASVKEKKAPQPISEGTAAAMQELQNILKPFDELTNKLQGDGVTSSWVIFGITCLYNALADLQIEAEDLSCLRTKICMGIVERFAASSQLSYKGRGARKQLLGTFSKKEYIIAAILDPRIKLMPFAMTVRGGYGLAEHQKSKEVAIGYLKAEEDYTELNHAAPSLSSQEPAVPAKKLKEDSIFSVALADTANDSQTACNSFEEEVNTYLAEESESIESNPLLYWRKSERKYPTLSLLARKYLSIPASSGSVERLFSIAGSLCRARRASLKVSTMENLLLHREWRMHF